MHADDLHNGFGEVYLPYALERKYKNAAAKWVWQYVFPAALISTDPCGGKRLRHHLSDNTLQRPVKQAILLAGVNNAARAILCVTASLLLCAKTTTTFAPCRNCSDTATCCYFDRKL